MKGGVSLVKFPGNFVYESNESTRRIKNYLREKQSMAKKTALITTAHTLCATCLLVNISCMFNPFERNHRLSPLLNVRGTTAVGPRLLVTAARSTTTVFTTFTVTTLAFWATFASTFATAFLPGSAFCVFRFTWLRHFNLLVFLLSHSKMPRRTVSIKTTSFKEKLISM